MSFGPGRAKALRQRCICILVAALSLLTWTAHASATDANAGATHPFTPPDEIFAMLAAPAGGRVVDFGTGIGTYAIEPFTEPPDIPSRKSNIRSLSTDVRYNVVPSIFRLGITA